MAASDPQMKRKTVGPRPVLSLLDLEHYEPVLRSASRAYVVADAESPSAAATQGAHEDGRLVVTVEDESIDGSAQVLPWTLPQEREQPPRRPVKAAGASPRARIRPLPPVGIAAREDVDIYRYSQAAEQRMAIRPLFERRREVGVAGVSGKLVGTEEDGDDERLQATPDGAPQQESDHVETDTSTSVTWRDEAVTHIHDGMDDNGDAVQQEADVDASATETGTDTDEIVDEFVQDEQIGQHEEINLDSRQIHFVPAMSLSLANCHEPFLMSESALMQKIRTAIPRVPDESTTHIKQPHCSASNELLPPSLKKVVWSGSRAFDDRQVAVSIMVASDGEICIACTDQLDGGQNDADDSRTAVITVTDGDLTLMKKLRADLTELTPEWVDWLVSRLTLRDEGSVQLDLDEMNSPSGMGSEHIFSKIISLSNDSGSKSNEVVVNVFFAREATTMTIRIEDAQAKQVNELHLSKLELKAIAAAIDSVDPSLGEVDIDILLHDGAFLERLCESDAVRLATQTLDPVDDSHDIKSDVTVASSVQATPQAIGVESYALDDSQAQEAIQPLIRSSDVLTSIALIAQAHSDSALLAAVRTLSQQEAVIMYANHYIAQAEMTEASDPSFDVSVQRLIEDAKLDKLNRLAIASILDDLLLDLLRVECQATFRDARRSSEFWDHFATKLQATFRMDRQRRAYMTWQQERQIAARAIQARQRGITSRRRFRRLQVDHIRMQHYGFAGRIQERKQEPALVASYDLAYQVRMLQTQTERVRHRLVMEVLAGCVLDMATSSSSDDGSIPVSVVHTMLDKFGSALAGCSPGLGHAVAQILIDVVGGKEESAGSTCFTPNQVSAALLLALRTSHKEASPWVDDLPPIQEQQRELSALQLSLQIGTKVCVPRWVLKANAAIRRENCEQQAKYREERHRFSQKAAMYAAKSYHSMLTTALTEFEQSRRVWEEVSRAHERAEKVLDDVTSVDQLVRECLNLMVASVKEWGIDADLLLDALNLCYTSTHGKQVVAIAEDQFDGQAAGLNVASGRVSILSLRDEIAQELDEHDKLLAMRCLVLARGVSARQLPSVAALLHNVLHGQLSDAQVRRALPAVLQIASARDKFELARRMVRGYGGIAFGEALNQICWSCVDGSERVAPEAAQLADLLTRLSGEENTELGCHQRPCVPFAPQDKDEHSSSSEAAAATVASRALARLTGDPFVRFLQFLAWAAHADAALQTRVRLLLSPLAANHELVRVASALSALEHSRDAWGLLARCFARPAVEGSAAFWVQYQTQFGAEARARALESCARHGQ